MSLHNQEKLTQLPELQTHRVLYPFYKASFSQTYLTLPSTSTVTEQRHHSSSELPSWIWLTSQSCTYLYWPAPPHDPQGIRVASGFEFSVCLSACLLVLCKFSNFWLETTLGFMSKVWSDWDLIVGTFFLSTAVIRSCGHKLMGTYMWPALKKWTEKKKKSITFFIKRKR